MDDGAGVVQSADGALKLFGGASFGGDQGFNVMDPLF
jgi:hypothetical protein